MKIYRHDVSDRVVYNTDNTETNFVVEEEYKSAHTVFGIFRFETNRNIDQSSREGKNKTSLGFK